MNHIRAASHKKDPKGDIDQNFGLFSEFSLFYDIFLKCWVELLSK